MTVMPASSANSFLHSLSMLRWLAIAGQAAAVLIAGEWLKLNLPIGLLWAGIGTLVAFNLYVTVRVHRSPHEASSRTAFCHLMVDIVVLTWMLGWSGGIHNPFGVMYLILIALAALALPRGWALAAAMACMIGYLISALLGHPIDGQHNPYALIVSGIATSFLISAMVVLYFSARIAADMRRRERELADLRERFTRNEGIVALATHAAAMAHELNTPLATMTLLVDEIAAEVDTDNLRSDAVLLSQLLALCRERIRNLAVPTEVDLVREVSQWRLVRPTIELQRTGELPTTLRVEPSISHLIQALLNNAADAAEAVSDPRVDLHLEYHDGVLTGEVRDYGRGIDPSHSLLPATTLFNSQKLGGLGVGLALSHATVEQLGGKMTMIPAKGGGTCIHFYLPLAPLATRDTGAPE